MAEKEVWRTVITFTSPKYADTPPSNIFMKSESKASAMASSIEHFEAQLKKYGYEDASFKAETFPSSMNEAILYVQQKKAGTETQRSIN
jgi:hypothetical protein